MKKIITFFTCMITTAAVAATAPAPAPRVSIFSTSTDWQALTGLQLSEYHIHIRGDKKMVGRGLVLYYLDGFPCYGLGDGVRTWIAPNGDQDGGLRIACVYPPREIKFSWRNAARDADQAASTGLLTCPATGDRDLTVDLSKCTQDRGWSQFE